MLKKCTPTEISPHQYNAWLDRRITFKKWSVQNTGQTANEMASAGFSLIQAQNFDTVTCKFCSIRLSNWQPTDCPFIEHVRHSPECPFINARDKPLMDLLKQENAWEKYKQMCINCKSRKKSVVLFPCSHLVLCKNCSNTRKCETCPVCFSRVYRSHEIYV